MFELDLDLLLDYFSNGQFEDALSYFNTWIVEKNPELSEQEEEQLLNLLIWTYEQNQLFGPVYSALIGLINAAFYKEEENFSFDLEREQPAKKFLKYCFSLMKGGYALLQHIEFQKYFIKAFQSPASIFREFFMNDAVITRLVCQSMNPNQFMNVFGESVLQCAVLEATDEVFRTLIELGADVNGAHEVPKLRRRKAGFGYNPIALRDFPSLNLFSELDEDTVPLEYQSDISPEAELMMQAESSMSFSPLQLAIIHNKIEMLEQLLHHEEIQANAQVQSHDFKGDNGDLYRNPTALMMAAYMQNIAAAERLIQKGVDLNALDNAGETALMYAARVHSIPMIELLLKAGAQFNISNIAGLDFIPIIQKYQYKKLLAQFERVEDFNMALANYPIKVVQFFQTRMTCLNYQVVPVQGDGNCLYHALELYLPYTHEQLRARAADFIEANPYIYAGHIQGNIAAYVAGIRSGAWGDHLEIDAIHRITERPIVVVFENDLHAPLEFGVISEENPAVYLHYNNVNHYDGLVTAEFNPMFVPQMSAVHYFQKLIRLPQDVRYHIGSFFSSEMIKKLFLSYENMISFFYQFDEDISSIKKSL